MNKPPSPCSRIPVALTIAGSDSGGGAGIQADLRAFACFGVFGTSVITAVTAQNPREVSHVHAVTAESVRKQLRAVLGAFDVGAAKTGMLLSSELIRTVVKELEAYPRLRLVVDPVMAASSGAKLLRDDAIRTLCVKLLPRAALITPNLPEAEILLGRRLRTARAVTGAASELARRFGCFVLIKGGHNPAAPGTDFGSDGSTVWKFHAAPVEKPFTTHGTGCALSAAIAACLAAGDEPLTAVRNGKAYVLGLIRNSRTVGGRLFAMWPPPRLPLKDVSVTEEA